MMSAPQSARWRTHVGPARASVRSSTRRPVSGSGSTGGSSGVARFSDTGILLSPQKWVRRRGLACGSAGSRARTRRAPAMIAATRARRSTPRGRSASRPRPAIGPGPRRRPRRYRPSAAGTRRHALQDSRIAHGRRDVAPGELVRAGLAAQYRTRRAPCERRRQSRASGRRGRVRSSRRWSACREHSPVAPLARDPGSPARGRGGRTCRAPRHGRASLDGATASGPRRWPVRAGTRASRTARRARRPSPLPQRVHGIRALSA